MDKFVKLGQDMVLLWSKYKVMYWAGIWNTLKLAFLATLIGCFIGLLCGVLNTIPYTKKDPLPKRFLLKLLRIIIRIYVEVFRGTPMVLQSVFIYYGLPYFSNNALRFDNIFAAALLIVAINTGAYMAESVRGGIISIDPGQTEGAKAIGMTHFQTMVNVIMPQALRNIMPQIGNNYIINVKDTSVMFIIGFTEFFAQHRYIVGVNNMYFPSATIEMIGYLTLTLIASLILRLVEKLMDGSDSYELAQGDQLVMAAGTYSHPDRGTPFDEVNREYTGEEKRNRIRIGLKNRNAYESQMHDYPMHCSSTLSCVYLDVNGLHELNNTRGHAAGDEMLKTVAAKVRDIFGEEYSYRVGGDEFVAFAMDKSAEEMRALIHKLVQEVDEAGYSVAVGTATHSAGGIDMEVLVKSAETRMYLAKEEHYRLAGKTRG